MSTGFKRPDHTVRKRPAHTQIQRSPRGEFIAAAKKSGVFNERIVRADVMSVIGLTTGASITEEVSTSVTTESGVGTVGEVSMSATASPAPSADVIPTRFYPADWALCDDPSDCIFIVEISESDFLRKITDQMSGGKHPAYQKISPRLYIHNSIRDVYSVLYFGPAESLYSDFAGVFMSMTATASTVSIYGTSTGAITPLLPLRADVKVGVSFTRLVAH